MKYRLSTRSLAEISENLIALRQHIPLEFARKPRSLQDLERWKATELRLFLLYVGQVCLKGKVRDEVYDNFLLLSTAIHILVNSNLCQQFANYAIKALLIKFVEHYSQLYGAQAIVYNVHGLVHIADDVQNLGSLDTYSAFPYENFLHELKIW